MARWLIAGLSPRRPECNPRPLHVGFMVDTAALGQDSRGVLRIYPVQHHANNARYSLFHHQV